MFLSFCFIPLNTTLGVQEIAALRKISPLSIVELRLHAAQGRSVLEMPALWGDWPHNVPQLKLILDAIEDGQLPLRVVLAEVYEDEALSDSIDLTVDEARAQMEDYLRQDPHA
ncbi:hypothetical protein V8J88_03590 [Massilia sp. W12]|uniref:hypothetical protein n=1 Tax=Massilia sp. W12 TaxID=3126507 RepID=UPI0030CB45F3